MKLRNSKEYTVASRVEIKNQELKSSQIKIKKRVNKRVSVPKEKRVATKTKQLTIKLQRIRPGNVQNTNWLDFLKEIERQEKKKGQDLHIELKRIMTDHVKPVDELVLDGNMSENWRKFKRNYNIFETAARVNTQTDDIKIATFLNSIGPNAVDLFDSFTLTPAQRAVYDTVVAAFETYCNPRKNVIYERYKFNQRNQRDGEKFDEFLVDLKLLSRYCDFGAAESELIRDSCWNYRQFIENASIGHHKPHIRYVC